MIFPRCQDYRYFLKTRQFIDDFNDIAAEINEQLRLTYKNSQDVFFLQQDEFYDRNTQYGTNERLIDDDGLHLSREGQQVLCDNIRRIIRDIRTGIARPIPPAPCQTVPVAVEPITTPIVEVSPSIPGPFIPQAALYSDITQLQHVPSPTHVTHNDNQPQRCRPHPIIQVCSLNPTITMILCKSKHVCNSKNV